MTKIILDIKNVNQWYMDGNKINHILHDINLKIVQGQFVALVGSSGCGKSTLLKSILGTNPPKSGKILENGREIVKPTRDIGIVNLFCVRSSFVLLFFSMYLICLVG